MAKVAKGSGRGSLPGERRGGRKAGTKNKKTQEQVKAIEDTGLTPLQFLTNIYREECPEEIRTALAVGEDKAAAVGKLLGWFDRRIEAAKAAAPYVHAKLVATHTTDSSKKSFSQWLEDLENEE